MPLWICPTGWPVSEPIQGLVRSLVSDVVEFRPASAWKTACGLVCSALVSLFVSTVRWLVDPAAAPKEPVVMPMLPSPLYAEPNGTIAADVAIERSRSAIAETAESPVSTEAVLVLTS